jgi:hypothetical protein
MKKIVLFVALVAVAAQARIAMNRLATNGIKLNGIGTVAGPLQNLAAQPLTK